MAPMGSAPGLYDGLFGRGEAAAAVADEAFLQAMLDVEAALVAACASVGLVPAEAVAPIAAACRAEHFAVAAIGQASAATGTPVVPLVEALRAAVGPELAVHVHHGATSQDIVDTGTMLVARRALEAIAGDLRRAGDAAAALASEHRATVLPGRTLLAHASPTTFGLKAAGWLDGLDGARGRVAAAARDLPAVQLGGAAGTLAAFGDRGPEVVRELAAALGLAEPPLPWHTQRLRPAGVATAAGEAAGVLGKVARDLTLLSQTEVGEVADTAERGHSSALPHKRNPVAAVTALACAQRAPALVATVLGAMHHEHERAAGSWHAEWEPLRELLRVTGSAAAWIRDALEHLEVRADRMAANLAADGGLLMAEAAVTFLAPSLGRARAQELVAEAVRRAMAEGDGLIDVLAGEPDVAAALGDVRAALAPDRYLGAAGALIDRVLELRD